MEQQIRYARTSDGFNIAYSVMGSGPTLIAMSAGLHQSIEFATKISNFRTAGEASARAFTYVRYDPRGSGLSDRDVDDFSIDAMARDLEAVADALPADHFMLFAPGGLGLSGVAFAARHPSRVTRLVLWASAVCGAEFDIAPLRPIRATAASDWRLASEAIIQAVDHWDNPDLARENAALMRASVDPATYLRYEHAMHNWDVGAVLPELTCPTLVIHPASNEYSPVANARRVAAAIPGARLLLVDSASVLMPDSEVVRAAGLFFLNRDRQLRSVPSDPARSAFRTVLFTDIVGHTEMMQRLGDAKGRDVLREHERITRETLKQHGGAEVKTMGDGFMASFGSVTQAMECAIALQRAFAAHSEKEGEPLSVRVGLNAGEPIEEDGDLFGATVILASRIAAKAAGGEILVPEPVRHLLSGKTFTFSDRGEHAMKGFDDAVRLYEVRWRE